MKYTKGIFAAFLGLALLPIQPRTAWGAITASIIVGNGEDLTVRLENPEIDAHTCKIALEAPVYANDRLVARLFLQGEYIVEPQGSQEFHLGKENLENLFILGARYRNPDLTSIECRKVEIPTFSTRIGYPNTTMHIASVRELEQGSFMALVRIAGGCPGSPQSKSGLLLTQRDWNGMTKWSTYLCAPSTMRWTENGNALIVGPNGTFVVFGMLCEGIRCSVQKYDIDATGKASEPLTIPRERAEAAAAYLTPMPDGQSFVVIERRRLLFQLMWYLDFDEIAADGTKRRSFSKWLMTNVVSSNTRTRIWSAQARLLADGSWLLSGRVAIDSEHTHGYLCKLDTNGKVLWERTVSDDIPPLSIRPEARDVGITAIAETTDGKLFVALERTDQAPGDGRTYTPWLMQLDMNTGETEWTKDVQGVFPGVSLSGMSATRDGRMLLAGQRASGTSPMTVGMVAPHEAFVALMESDSRIVWKHSFQMPRQGTVMKGNDEFDLCIETKDLGVLCQGRGAPGEIGSTDAWLKKLRRDGAE